VPRHPTPHVALSASRFRVRHFFVFLSFVAFVNFVVETSWRSSWQSADVESRRVDGKWRAMAVEWSGVDEKQRAVVVDRSRLSKKQSVVTLEWCRENGKRPARIVE
jgi:hypothetical protein